MTGCLATTSETAFLITDTSGLVFLLLPAGDNQAFVVRASKGLSDSIATTIVPGDLFSEMVNILGGKRPDTEWQRLQSATCSRSRRSPPAT